MITNKLILSESPTHAVMIPPRATRLNLKINHLTQAIRPVAESPGRCFQHSHRIRHNWSETSETKLPSTARSVQSPELREQLYHLHHLLDHKAAADKSFPNGKLFAWALAHSWENCEPAAMETLGKLVYLIDCKDVDFKTLDLDRQLATIFQDKIEKKLQTIATENETDVRYFRSQIEKMMATMLVSSEGLINLGLIPTMKTLFIRLEPEETGYSQNFINSLNYLQEISTIRKKLASFEKPHKHNHLGKEIIRVSLNLSNTHKIETVDVVRTALKAYLSYPRQDHAANCFALSLAISFFSTSRGKCLDDFREILSYGYLKKTIEGQSVYFPALLRQPLETVFQPLNEQNHVEISKRPRIKRLLQKLRRDLPTDLPENVSIDEILTRFGTEKQTYGRFLWESNTKDPLIAIWSNILASMAEGRADGMVKSALINACAFVTTQKTGGPEVAVALKKELLERVHLHYDPSVQSYETRNGSSNRRGTNHGAFVLYDKKEHMERIDTPEKFQIFLSRCLSHSDLAEWFQKPKTLFRLLEVYHPASFNCERSLEAIKNLSYTPWVTKIGNDPRQILRTYKGSHEIDPTQEFKPRTTEELFHKIISFGHDYFAHQMTQKRAHSSVLIPARIVGVHAFNLTLSHPSFTKCLVEGGAKTLAELKAIAMNKAIAPLPPDTKNALFRYLSALYPEDTTPFKTIPDFCTILEFREHLVASYPASVVDKKLFQFLPDEMKEELGQKAIHFADTNRSGNNRDIHYVFSYNPVSLKLTVFQAEESGKLLSPKEDHSSITKDTWEFFTNPDNVLPQD